MFNLHGNIIYHRRSRLKISQIYRIGLKRNVTESIANQEKFIDPFEST